MAAQQNSPIISAHGDEIVLQAYAQAAQARATEPTGHTHDDVAAEFEMVETPVGAQRRDLPTTSGEWEHVAADDDTGTHPGHPTHGDTGASPEYNPFTESTGPPHDDPPQQPATEPTGPPQPAVPGAAVLPPIGGTNASSAASSYTSETDGDGEVSPTPVYSPTRQEKEAETESAPGHDAATPGVKEDKAKSAQGHDPQHLPKNVQVVSLSVSSSYSWGDESSSDSGEVSPPAAPKSGEDSPTPALPNNAVSSSTAAPVPAHEPKPKQPRPYGPGTTDPLPPWTQQPKAKAPAVPPPVQKSPGLITALNLEVAATPAASKDIRLARSDKNEPNATPRRNPESGPPPKQQKLAPPASSITFPGAYKEAVGELNRQHAGPDHHSGVVSVGRLDLTVAKMPAHGHDIPASSQVDLPITPRTEAENSF